MFDNSILDELASLIESPALDLKEIRAACIEGHAIDPLNVYCFQTGRVIGTITEDELAIAAESVRTSGTDIESLADELVSQTLAFVRPSPVWGHMTPERLRVLTNKHPHHVLSYCLTRFQSYYEQDGRKRMSYQERLEQSRIAIKTWSVVSQWDTESDDVAELLIALLHIDTLGNLHRQPWDSGIDITSIPSVLRFTRRVHAQLAARKTTTRGSKISVEAAKFSYFSTRKIESGPLNESARRWDRKQWLAIIGGPASSEAENKARKEKARLTKQAQRDKQRAGKPATARDLAVNAMAESFLSSLMDTDLAVAIPAPTASAPTPAPAQPKPAAAVRTGLPSFLTRKA